MRVVKIESHTVKTYTVSIEDGGLRPQPYSRPGRRYRVARITIEKRDGNVASVKLHGPVLKKDGTDSLNSTTERLYGHREWPEWLHGVIGGLA